MRATTSGGPYSTVAFTETTSFIDREVAANTTYYYVVKANNAAGPGPISAQVSASSTAAPTVALGTGLQYHYPFNGSNAESRGGTALTIAGTATYPAGMMSQALGFDGSTNFGALPALTGSYYRDFTVSGWIWASSNAAWQRVFDFGNGTSDYMMVTRSEYGNLRFVLRQNGVEDWVQTPYPPNDRWFHLAVTFSGNWATIYINGAAQKVLLCRNNPAHITLAKNYLGKSQYTSDPLFNGRMDDFRLYNRGLSAAEVSALVMSAPSMPPYDLLAGGFGTRVTLSWQGVVNATSYNVKRATTKGGPYTSIATNLTGTTYVDTSSLAANTTYYYVVTGKNSVGESVNSNESAARTSDLSAYLKFDETSGTTAADSSGNNWHASLINGPAFSAGALGNALDLPNTAAEYASLPKGVVSGLNDFTISAWVRVAAFNTWARIFDFGTDTTNYMFLTPQYDGSTANAGKMRFVFRAPSTSDQIISSSTALPLDTWAHVAVTLSGATGRLYLNGVEVGSNTSMSLKPSSLGFTTRNYLGKSQFNDPYFDGLIDDFRIYARALSATEISALAKPQ